MNQIKAALDLTRPVIAMVSILFAFIAAWLGLGELIPFLKQIWSPHGDVTHMAIIAAALALAAGRY